MATAMSWFGRSLARVAVLAALIAGITVTARAQQPIAGPNINMVRGTKEVLGDPFLQRQNEPTIAVSSRNPCHLFAGANDYRTVDIPDKELLPNDTTPVAAAPAGPAPKDAWLGWFKSFDCGASWRSGLIPGYPQDGSSLGMSSPLKGLAAGADSTVRSGTNGLFFYSGMVFNRGDNGASRIFITRYIDDNNNERGDTIRYLGATVIDTGTKGQFSDKPWLAVDMPRNGYGPAAQPWTVSETGDHQNGNSSAKDSGGYCDIPADPANGIPAQHFAAGNAYMAWTRFDGNGTPNPSKIMFARSTDCGVSWNTRPISNNQKTSQGAAIAIAPSDGTVYVAWREFGKLSRDHAIWIARSTDGGKTFDKPRAVATPINPYDQSKSETRFRTNTLPTIAVDHLGRVYVAWAERGYATASGRLDPITGDARIVMAVSTDGANTFKTRYPIADRKPTGSHQIMPALRFTAGQLQMLFYDFADDVSRSPAQYVDDAGNTIRHTVDVAAATASPADHPVFQDVLVTPDGTNPKISEYRTLKNAVTGTLEQVQWNPPNLPLYVDGSTPFLGDYIDIAGLDFVPIRQGTTDVWQPNLGAINFSGGSLQSSSTNGFPLLPVFHATWTDHRDVKPPLDGNWKNYVPPGQGGAFCEPAKAGMRNANIYTSRLTTGLYVGSPGNTKPLGFTTIKGQLQHIQRGFVVFLQNTTKVKEPKRFLVHIANQPGTVFGDRASFLQNPRPPYVQGTVLPTPETWRIVAVPPLSTVARTVYVTATNPNAQVRVEVAEIAASTPISTILEGSEAELATLGPPLAVNGLRTSVLLNPDSTNPPITDPDFVSDTLPSVTGQEEHDPAIFDPLVTSISNVKTSLLEIRTPDEGNPDEGNQVETPDEGNPDEGNPDEGNPDEGNPDEGNAGLLNTALGDSGNSNPNFATTSITDVQWKVSSKGNTTSAFKFRPTFKGSRTGKRFQLFVTRRYYVPTIDPITCDLIVHRSNQVLVNVSDYKPRNPDEGNPDEGNPDEGNPDEGNPDEGNATFMLAPGETATVTLRVYDTTAPDPAPEVVKETKRLSAGLMTALATDTTEAKPSSAASGSDLVILNTRATDNPGTPRLSQTGIAPGGTLTLFWTLKNRGTAATLATESPFNNRFVLRDTTGVAADRDLAVTPFTGVVPFDNPATPAVEGEVELTQSLTIPRNVPPGSYVVVIVADSANTVFEADDFNNTDSVPLSVAFTLTFSAQPSQTTQDFTMTPAVSVLVLDGVGAAVGGAEVPQLALTLSGGAATLAGTLTRPNTGGVATFNDLHVNNVGSSYRLNASAFGSFAAISNLFTIKVDAPPVSQGESYQTNEEQTLTAGTDDGDPPGTLDNDTDEIKTGPGQPPAGRQLTAVLVNGPAHAASFSLQPNGSFTYAPAANYSGPDSFTYKANDGRSDGNTVTVSITVVAVNDPPTGINDSLSSAAEDSGSRSISFASLLANDSAGPNEASQVLTITAVGSAVGGTVSINGTNVLFAPTANYNGPASFAYTLQDNGTTGGSNAFLTATATASFTITEVNDAPTGTADALSSVPPNSGPRTISFASLLANDVAGPANESTQLLTITAVASAVGGAVNISGTNVIFTPATNYGGPASFVYTLRDNGTTAGANAFLTATAQVSFTITAAPPPTTTADTVLTVTDYPMTTNPAANDLDPDVAAPEVRTTYSPFAGPVAPLNFPGEVAVISSTNRAYFTGANLGVATNGRLGILDTANNTLVGTTEMTVNSGALLTRVSQSTQIAYLRAGTNLVAVDGRTASPTLNQLILNINLGSIQSMAVDETQKRLYVSAISFNPGNVNTGRVSVVDIDPGSSTFHTVITDVQTPGNPTSIATNPATNKVYVFVSGGGTISGVYMLDGASFSLTQVFTTPTISAIAVNDLDNVIYAVGGSTLFAIDGATDTKVKDVPLGGSAAVGAVDSRLAIHRVTGKVYVRLSSFPNDSDLVVVDGKVPADAAVVLPNITGLGRETGTTSLWVDEAANRLVTTSPIDFKTVVINTTTNAIVNTVIANQPLGRATIDRVSHRAYVTGGFGYIQVVNLSTGALVTNVPVGVELFGTLVDSATHTAFVPQTGMTTDIKIINETGAIGSFVLPHSAGRQVFMARNSVTNKIYALNSASNAAGTSDALPGFVSVIDGTSHAVLQNISVGAFPFGIAVDESNNKIYVGNSSAVGFNGGISIIDGATNVVTAANLSAIPQGAPNVSPVVGRDMVVTSNGKLYFRVTTGGPVQFLGVLNGTVGTAVPGLGLNNNFNLTMLKYNPVLNRLYVGATSATTGDHQVFVINPLTDQIVATISVGSPSLFIPIQSYIAVNTTTARVYVGDFDDDQLVAIDGNTNTVVGTIKVPFGPSTVAVDEVRNRVYVGSAYAKALTIIDGATMRVARTIALPITPVRLEVDAGLTPARIYALAVATEGKISVIDDPGTAAPQITGVTQAAHGTVVLNADGSVTYTSNSGYAGSDSYTYTISGLQGGTATGTANVTVYAEFAISTTSLGNGQVGQSYSQTLQATGGTGATTLWSIVTGFPGGLHFNTGGVLSGKFAQPGTFTFTVTARDSGQPLLADSRTYTMNVGPSFITPTSLPSATVNAPYSTQLITNGAAGAVTWSVDTSGNPALSWLSISNAGVLSGTPSSYGTTPPFTVTLNDPSSTPPSSTRSYTIFVTGPLTMADLREGIVLETQPSVTFLGGNGTRALSITGGALPPGIVLGTGGVFTGAPTRHGTYNFTLELQDCQNSSCNASIAPQTVSKNIAWRVTPKDQLGGSQSGGTLSFGGSTGRKLAQVFTVGSQGTLTAIGLSGMTCPVTQTTVRVEIQRLTDHGVPDGHTIAAGSAQSLFLAIGLTPALPVAIGEKLAFVASIDGPLTCSISNPAHFDSYNAGDAYAQTSGNWIPLIDTADAAYDIPSFRTQIMPAMDVTYLQASRGTQTMTRLTTGPNAGKVLIVGGSNVVPRIAELYDPATNTTSPTGETAIVRHSAAATMLGDGTVLITGGHDENNNKIAWAEIYDPISGTFSRTTGNMFNSRDNHRAVRFVVSGVEKVLITGGNNPFNSNLAAPELYDPVSQTFTLIGNNLNGRQNHIAVLLTTGPNAGKILLAGGYTNGGVSAELFNPATNTFSATGTMIVSNRGAAAAAVLSDGKVLITGGQSGDIRDEAEIYDPLTGLFSSAGIMKSRRHAHTATLLADGSVLIAGGYADQQLSSFTLPLATMERYVPGTGFVAAGSMETRHGSHAAVVLADGRVLIAGGFGQTWMTGNTGELFDNTASVSFTPATLTAATPSQPYSVQFTGAGGSGGYAITHVGGMLPPGLTYTPSTRTLGGAPTTAGIYQFALQVEDSAHHANVQSLTLVVGSVNTITSPYRLPDAPQNNFYSYQLEASGTGNTWSLLPATSSSGQTNPLPTTITLSPSGLLEGTPTFTGYYNFGVRAVDGNGVEAVKVLSISVPSPLTINTTTMGNPELFNSLNCISVSNGIGLKTYSIASGTLPAGVTFNGTSNSSCISFTGQIKQTGAFTFKVHIVDQSSNPQIAERQYTINVYAADQQTFNGSTAISFGGTTGVKLAERVITGITGTLTGIRTQGLICGTNGTSVSVQIQGLDAGGKPNGEVMATGIGLSPLGTIYLNSGVFFTADQPFTVVFDAANACSLKPSTFDSYPGDGFISPGGGAWSTVNEYDAAHAMYDVPFTSIVDPVPGLLAMNSYRGRLTATLLDTGKVLLAGGDCCLPNPLAELFNPADNTTSSTGIMTTSRQGHTATKLDNGKVLLTGGSNNAGTNQSSAEIYDPGTNTFTATGPMNFARINHQATLLLDGTVLITGGFSGSGSILNSAEIFNPANGTFANVTATMAFSRYYHTATRLNSGNVLIAAGYGAGSNAEFYNPLTQTFTTAPSLNSIRGDHTATLLNDGKVLIAGGHGGPVGEALATAELYDPSLGPDGQFVVTSSMSTPRLDHSATKLGDGSVLIVGGYTDSTCCYPHAPTAVLERYVPGTGFINSGAAIVARYAQASVLMGGNKVLIAGTYGWSSAGGRTAEIFNAAALPPYLEAAETTGHSGAPLNFTLTPKGGSGSGFTMTLMSGTLPSGTPANPVVLNLATGELTGTPTQSGTFKLTIKIVDSLGRTSYQIFSLKIDPLTIGTTSLPTAYQGVEYNGLLQATGVGDITWSIISSNGLPPGLSLNANTGAITQAPTVSCCFYSFTVKAKDSLGQTAVKALGISVQQALTIGTTSLWDGFAGQTYGNSLWAYGGAGGYTWSFTGGPIGLAIEPTTGFFKSQYPVDILRQGGSFTIAATVVDSSMQSASKNLTLNVFAQDQWLSAYPNPIDVAFNAGRKLAQVFRAGTPFGISGVTIWPIRCDAGVTLTGKVYPVTEGGLPNDADLPLRTATLTSNASGFFDTNNLIFSPSVSLNQAQKFSLVFSTSGHCVVTDWPDANDYYQFGDAWVNDGAGWNLASGTSGVLRYDLPLATLITPSAGLRFLVGWRGGHVSAKLNDGRVFLAGAGQETEIYDPSTNSLEVAALMSYPRQEATATVLTNGKVLVAGGSYYDSGSNATQTTVTTQLFNPTNGQFEASEMMSAGRIKHTATRLANGNVLLAGGQSIVNSTWTTLQSADLIDSNGLFVATINMSIPRAEHTATLLNDGRVLIVGGWTNISGPVAEIYDPTAGPHGSFTALTSTLPGFAWPTQHTATLLTTGPRAGQVLIAGGYGYPTLGGNYFYNRSTDTFTTAPSLLTPRLDHVATTLPNGRIVFSGGVVDVVSNWISTSSVEIYDPATGEQAYIGQLVAERNTHSADVVSTPNGLKLAVAGGWGQSSISSVTIEQFDLGALDGESGNFAASNPMIAARGSQAAVELDNGKVLLAGSDDFLVSAELYNPSTNTTAATGSLGVARCYGCSYVKLLNGKVLIAGGYNGASVLSSAEIYDPIAGTFSATGNMPQARLGGNPVLLNSGKVLILGGHDGSNELANAVLYDPTLGTFSFTGGMSIGRTGAAVVKLADGRVLVAGGQTTGHVLTNASEIYNPASGTFSPTGNTVIAGQFDGILLADGRVLIAGSWPGTNVAQVYNPAFGTFTTVGSMTTSRTGHSTVRLANGTVLVLGGIDGSSVTLNSAEIFDPVSNLFTRIANLPSARWGARAILLTDGRVMISGGFNGAGQRVNTVEFYVP